MAVEEDKYLGYLDKEMSIMGILSTFCVAVPALILERLASAAKESDLAAIWGRGETYFWIASALMLISAALFYKQRSLLAFYYGRISRGEPPTRNTSVPNYVTWQDWADSWTTWIPYHAGFWVGAGAVLEYAIAFLSVKGSIWAWGAAPLLALAAGLAMMVIIQKDRPIRFSDNPWVAGIKRLRKRK